MRIGSSYIPGGCAASHRSISALYHSIWITRSSSTGEYGPGPERGVPYLGLSASDQSVVLGRRDGRGLRRVARRSRHRLPTGTGGAGAVGTSRIEAVELTDGTRPPADVVVVAIGAAPNIDWLAHSGVALGNGVLTDPRGATNIPGVVAVGDCAAAWSASAERHVRIEHWTHALEQPATAVATLLGAGGPAPTPVPYFWSDQYGARIQFAGTRREGDIARVVEGSCADRSFLVLYERDGEPVAVLGMDQPRLFTRWRRQLRSAVPTTC